MAASTVRLLKNEPLRRRLGANGVRDAQNRFDLERQADDYLDWYQQIMDDWHTRRSTAQDAVVEHAVTNDPDGTPAYIAAISAGAI